MKYAKLGNTDIEVSKICIGGMSFGEASKNFHEWTLNQEESTKMIKEAYDLGVNFIDLPIAIPLEQASNILEKP